MYTSWLNSLTVYWRFPFPQCQISEKSPWSARCSVTIPTAFPTFIFSFFLYIWHRGLLHHHYLLNTHTCTHTNTHIHTHTHFTRFLSPRFHDGTSVSSNPDSVCASPSLSLTFLETLSPWLQLSRVWVWIHLTSHLGDSMAPLYWDRGKGHMGGEKAKNGKT